MIRNEFKDRITNSIENSTSENEGFRTLINFLLQNKMTFVVTCDSSIGTLNDMIAINADHDVFLKAIVKYRDTQRANFRNNFIPAGIVELAVPYSKITGITIISEIESIFEDNENVKKWFKIYNEGNKFDFTDVSEVFKNSGRLGAPERENPIHVESKELLYDGTVEVLGDSSTLGDTII